MNSSDSFFEQVYEITRHIPVGRVTSFGAIARCIGSPQSARMVGWALNKSGNVLPPVPAHRVVNRNGLLTGKHHFGGSEIMKELLENEGIIISENQVVDFGKLFWDPMKEL
ncbi:MAG: MGMT family protein [Bacteroidia bacterium]|nr:MGMT family protein [Bacteroidia bacterium]